MRELPSGRGGGGTPASPSPGFTCAARPFPGLLLEDLHPARPLRIGWTYLGKRERFRS